MALDPNIILQQKQPQFQNPIEAAQNALTMRALSQRTQIQDQQIGDDQALRRAYQNNTAIGPDGSVQVNRPGLMGDLNGHGALAVQESQKLSAQDLMMKKQKMDQLQDTLNTGKMLLAQLPTGPNVSMQDKQDAWTKMKLQGQQLGMPDNDKLPDQYPGDQFVATMQMHHMTAEEQLAQQNKDFEHNQKGQELQYQHEKNQIDRERMLGDRGEKAMQDLRKDLDPDAARTGNFGQISAKIQAGQRVKALLNSYPNLNDVPKGQVEEAALGMANMISGSTGAARSQVEAIVPSSARGDASALWSWVSNNPQGAQQKAFLDMYSHTIDREMDLANDQLNTIREKRLAFHERAKALVPGQYAAALSNYGLDPRTGKRIPPEQAAPPTSDYDGSQALPADADPQMKVKRAVYLQNKAQGGR